MEELRCRRCGCDISDRENNINNGICFVCTSDIKYRDPLALGSASSTFMGTKSSKKPSLDELLNV